MTFISFGIGFIVGAFCGLICMALVSMNRDDHHE